MSNPQDGERKQEGERRRNARTGSVGVLVKKEKHWFVRHKHGSQMLDVLYDPDVWKPEFDEIRPATPGQRGMVAFATDQRFCEAMGRYGHKRMWASLTRAEMKSWQDPDNPPIPQYTTDMNGDRISQADRRRLYLFVHRGMMPPKREQADGED